MGKERKIGTNIVIGSGGNQTRNSSRTRILPVVMRLQTKNRNSNSNNKSNVGIKETTKETTTTTTTTKTTHKERNVATIENFETNILGVVLFPQVPWIRLPWIV